jgi:hypothetical protein
MGRLSGVFARAEIVTADIDESDNQLVFGLNHRFADPTPALELVRQAGVPERLVRFEISEGRPVTTLRDSYNTTVGGIQVRRGYRDGTYNSQYDEVHAGECTLGAVAYETDGSSPRYMFASHCTNYPFLPDTTEQHSSALSTWTAHPITFQPTIGPGVSYFRFGAGDVDPPAFACPSDPNELCRWSDIAMSGQGLTDPTWEYAKIVRTSSGITQDATNPRWFVQHANDGYLAEGDDVDKVGRSTGKTSGDVVVTCMDRKNTHLTPNVTMLCSYRVDAEVDTGDSGAPAFMRNGTGSNNNVTLVGIVFYENTRWAPLNDQFEYSPLGNWYLDTSISMDYCSSASGGSCIIN